MNNEIETGNLFQNLALKLKQVTKDFVPPQMPVPSQIVAARQKKKLLGRPPFLTPKELEELKRHPGEKSKKVVEFVKGAARDFPRSVASLYLAAEGRKQLVPETAPEKFLFGKEPVRRPQEEGTVLLKTLGVKEKSAKRYGGAVGYPLAILGAIPLMPGKKQVGKEIAEQLAKRYGDDVAKLIVEKGGKDLAELALKEGGENVVQRAGLTLAGRAVQAETRVPAASVKTRPVEYATGARREAEAGIQSKLLPTGTEDAITLEKKIVSQQFRGDKLNLPADQLAEIEKRRQALGLTTREVRTFADMEEAAKELGTDVKMLLRDTAGKRLADKEVVALRNLININSQRLVELERELLENPTKEAVLKMQMGIANQQVDEALKKLVRGGTESGRAVAAFRIMAQRTLEPDIWFRQAQRVIGERELTDEMRAAIVSLIKDKDIHGLATFVSALRNPSFAEKAITLWKAGLLTSPTTHLANVFGNITMAVLQTASDTLATGFDILASLATHKRTVTVSSATIAARARGFLMGSREAREFIRTGMYSMDLMRKYDLPRVVAFKNRVLRGYTNAIFRSLGAEDVMFRQAAMGESFTRQAEVMALNEGLRGSGFKERIKFLLQNPTNEMVAKAIDDAEYVTFQSKNVMADLISGAKRAVRGKGIAGEVAATATEFVAPFVKTPTNIAARIADYSPLWFMRALTSIARPATRSQEAFVRQLGRAVTGSTVMAFGAYLAEKGLLTGNAPTKIKDRDMFYAEGKQAHSIRLGSQWFQLNRLSPFGNLLALGADFHEQDKEEGGAALVSGTVAAGLKGLTEQTFLKGVSGGLKALTEPERSAKKFVQQSVASIIPTIINRVARTFDPTLRVADTVLQSVQERLPYFRKQLPVRRDIFGEPVKSPSGRLALIDPFGVKPAMDDQLINEARRLGIAIGVPTQTISGTKLDNAEFSFYQKVQGRILRQYLTALYQSSEYQSLSSADQEKKFEGVLKDVRDQINDTVFPALMIKRYELPSDTNPEVIREVLNSLNKDERFKNLDRERQVTAIKEVISQVLAGVK